MVGRGLMWQPCWNFELFELKTENMESFDPMRAVIQIYIALSACSFDKLLFLISWRIFSNVSRTTTMNSPDATTSSHIIVSLKTGLCDKGPALHWREIVSHSAQFRAMIELVDSVSRPGFDDVRSRQRIDPRNLPHWVIAAEGVQSGLEIKP